MKTFEKSSVVGRRGAWGEKVEKKDVPIVTRYTVQIIMGGWVLLVIEKVDYGGKRQ